MPTTVEIDVRLGVVIVKVPNTGERKIIDRLDTAKVTLTLDDQIIYKDADDAEAPSPPWEPLHPAKPTSRPPTHTLERNESIWKNNLYTVTRSEWDYPGVEESPTLVHLSIRRNDRRPVTDWRHKQQIKNQLTDPECEGIELYPAESRLVDTSNQFHLWVLPKGMRAPVGYEDGRITCGEAPLTGAKQRPFVDGEQESVTTEQLDALTAQYQAAAAQKAERDDSE